MNVCCIEKLYKINNTKIKLEVFGHCLSESIYIGNNSFSMRVFIEPLMQSNEFYMNYKSLKPSVIRSAHELATNDNLNHLRAL